jgi:RNA polymerase sigma factor (TIGR02999 family)
VDQTEDVTQLLTDASNGDRRAMDRLWPLVYDELRALAAAMMQAERPDHTLQPTALVHEAYQKLIDQSRVRWQDRAHFFAVAAQAIRRILVDHARAHRRAKRGGQRVKLALDEALAAMYESVVDLIALDEALARLAESHPQQARVVEMRFFAGLTIEETAALQGVSASTIERDWRYARATLYRALSDGSDRHG